MQKVSAIVIHDHGDPVEVVRVEERTVGPPASGQALVRMLAAPINPADINVLEGKYPIRPELPGVPGNEGVGEVVELGEGVTAPAVGTRVAVPHGVGAWAQAVLAPANRLVPLPPEADIDQASMLMVNPPTAWRMLHDFVTLQEGDWIVQNAANSGVGRAVIQICRSLGVRSINLVRRQELVEELTDEGADAVVVEGENAIAEMNEHLAGAKPRLGLNAVGGESALRVARVLANGAAHVTYGAMSRQPLRLPNGLLIFKNIQFRGFWVSRWFKETPPAEWREMFDPLIAMLQRGQLRVKIAATYPLSEAKAAIDHARKEARGGKILFRF